MKQLPDVDAIYQQMDQARRAGPLVTNFYPVPAKLQRSVERGELFSLTAGNVLFVLRRDRDFLHLSFIASAAADLPAALREVSETVQGTLTVDVLGRSDSVEAVAAPFLQAGFGRHRSLVRMTRVAQTAAPTVSDPAVVLAGPEDAAPLARMLESALDRHAEQIPDEEELSRAIANREILIIRSGGAIAGMLFFEATGQTSLLRHWLVDDAHRNQRIGSRLMQRYFADCKDVRRFVLWVISDNDNAIDRYRHYGYQHDGLIDQVLIRRAA